MKRSAVLFLVLMVLCGLFTVGVHAGTVEVLMKDNFFEPSEVTVQAGDTVQWVHSGIQPHSTTSGVDPNSADGLWDSGFLFFAGQSFSVVFNGEGTFPYHCRNHWFSGMNDRDSYRSTRAPA